jgi:hypothetical protein
MELDIENKCDDTPPNSVPNIQSCVTYPTNKKHENYIEKLLLIQAILSMIHFICDFIIEILTLIHVITKIPIRISYMLLSFVTAFLSYKTFDAIKSDQYAVAHEDIQAAFLLEISQLISDLWFLEYDKYYDLAFDYRIGFMVSNIINIVIISFIMCKYKLWSIRYRGEI